VTISASEKELGFVYFVTDGEAIKIGWSKQIVKRISSLQSSSGRKLEVLATFAGGQYQERMLHHRFEHLRFQGEWFWIDDEIIDFIKFLGEASRLISIDEHYDDHKITQARNSYRKAMGELAAEREFGGNG
jgi:hypothetical protein